MLRNTFSTEYAHIGSIHMTVGLDTLQNLEKGLANQSEDAGMVV